MPRMNGVEVVEFFFFWRITQDNPNNAGKRSKADWASKFLLRVGLYDSYLCDEYAHTFVGLPAMR